MVSSRSSSYHIPPVFLAAITILATTAIAFTDPDDILGEILPTPNPPTVYTAIFPRIIVPFKLYSTIIFLNRLKHDENQTFATEPLWLKAKVKSGTAEYESERIRIQPGNYATVALTPGDLPKYFTTLRLICEDMHGKSCDSESQIYVQDSANYERELKNILIEADKPIYKPGEKVLFRVLLLDSNYRPTDSTNTSLTATILDPNKILIKSLKIIPASSSNIFKEFGLFEGQLELSYEAKIGTWRIIATVKRPSGKSIETTTNYFEFKVENEDQPKFEAFLKLPSYILVTEKSVSVSIQVKYSNGGSFQGDCTLIARLNPSGRDCGRERETSLVFPVSGYNAISKDFSIEDMITCGYTPKPGDTLKFEATVQESGTGKNITVVESIKFGKFPHKIRVVEETEWAIGNLYYNITLQVVTLDNVPVTDPESDGVQIFTNLLNPEGSNFTVSIQKNGQVPLNFQVPPPDKGGSSFSGFSSYTCEVFFIKATYKNHTFTHIPRNTNDNNNFMQLIPDSPFAKPNSNVVIRVIANSPQLTSLNYGLLSQNKLLTGGATSFPVTNEHSLNIKVPDYDGSHLTVVVFAYMKKRCTELILESLVLTNPDRDPNNFLTLTTTDENIAPGENITLTIASKKRSLITLTGTDVSMLLLPYQLQELTWKYLYSRDASRYEGHGFDFPHGTTLYRLSTSINTGNRGLKSHTCEKPMHYPNELNENWCSRLDFLKEYERKSNHIKQTEGISMQHWHERKVYIRHKVYEHKYFPETWLWKHIQLSNDSTAINITIPAPKTSKSWMVTGYSLNPSQNIKVLSSPLVGTLPPLSISLNLANSVVRGEVLIVEALIQNNLPTHANVSVTLKNPEGAFEFEGQRNITAVSKLIRCRPNSVCTTYFSIQPIQFGRISLPAIAQALGGDSVTLSEDSISNMLFVAPPGRKITGWTAGLLNVVNSTLSLDFESSFPNEYVRGSENIKISVTSELLQLYLKNLMELMESPMKTAEHNIVNFALAATYLKHMKRRGRIEFEVTSKITSFLEKSYQTQLRYRLHDGSFSSFGTSGDKGSTWLTAFAIQSLNAAKELITIDDRILHEGLTFIRNQTDPISRSFLERSGIKTEASSGATKSRSKAALTALCLVTLLQAEREYASGNKNRSDIDDAFDFLAKESYEDDLYSLALATYAMQIKAAKFSDPTHVSIVENFFIKLKSLAVLDDNNVPAYWRTSDSDRGKVDAEDSVKPEWVEATGYALMVYVMRKELDSALPIVKWLLNSSSRCPWTQGTAVAMTALVKYAETKERVMVDLQIEVAHAGAVRKAAITASNAHALQELELPSQTTPTTITASGSGDIAAQMTWSYYMEEADDESVLRINVSVAQTAPIFVTLSVCLSPIFKDGSDVVVIEVSLPSGYVLDNDGLSGIADVPGYKRYSAEEKNTKLRMYVNMVTQQTTCIGVSAYEAFVVKKRVPSVVSIYDFYETTVIGRKSYFV